MFETLFGEGVPLPVRFLIAFLIVLGLIGGTAWAVRRFGGDRLGSSALRGRQPRLAVIDAAPVDSRRRLLLIRRDNVEHLLMIGGPTDVVVESNIVRAVSARDNIPAARGAADTLARAVPLPEGSNWPLQPEPAPIAPAAPLSPPPSRPSTRAPLIEEPAAWTVPDPEPTPPIPVRPRAEPRIAEPRIAESRPAEARSSEPRQPEARPFDPRLDARQIDARRAEPRPAEPRITESRGPEPRMPEPRIPERTSEQRSADTLAGLADELSSRLSPTRDTARETAREPARSEPARAESARSMPPAPEPVRAPSPSPSPAPSPVVTAEAQSPESNDQNLADMAQRLEAALRRPMAESLAVESAPVSEPAAPKPMPRIASATAPAPRAAEPVRAPVTPAAPVAAVAPAAPPAPESKPVTPAEVKAAQPANFYDSLEQEMASLLGRPQSKG